MTEAAGVPILEVAEAPPAAPAPKPGWATSEHWLAFLTGMPGLAVSAGLVAQSSPIVAIASQVLSLASVAIYTWSRTRVKTAAS